MYQFVPVRVLSSMHCYFAPSVAVVPSPLLIDSLQSISGPEVPRARRQTGGSPSRIPETTCIFGSDRTNKWRIFRTTYLQQLSECLLGSGDTNWCRCHFHSSRANFSSSMPRKYIPIIVMGRMKRRNNRFGFESRGKNGFSFARRHFFPNGSKSSYILILYCFSNESVPVENGA